jgi:hypothetical protein
MGKEHDIQKFEGATRNGQSRDTGNNVHKKKAKQNKTEQKRDVHHEPHQGYAFCDDDRSLCSDEFNLGAA